MVGVPKSRGCATCRHRKIRCDETWPVCQQCQRNGRCCPGPSARHGKFLEYAPLARSGLQPSAASAKAKSSSPDTCHAPCTDIETVRTRVEPSGGMFQTLKIISDEPADQSPTDKQMDPSPAPRERSVRHGRHARTWPTTRALPMQLPLSGLERLTCRLVATINEESPSNQMRLFGPFIGEVPRRLGSNVALKHAAACLTATHDAILRKHSKDRIDARLYVTALNSLHAAIDDPVEVQSTSTLCATALLAITEAYAVGTCGTNRNFITHLGGAARILELQGPAAFRSATSFERGILRAITVGVGLDALFTNKDDLLTSPAWHDLAFDTTGLVEPRYSMNRISRAMAFLPSLARDVRAYNAGASGPGISPVELYERAEALRTMLAEVEPYVEATLADKTRVRRVPPLETDAAAMWPMSFRFKDSGTAFVLWFYWNMSMIAASIIIALHRRPASAMQLPQRPAYMQRLRQDCLGMARFVCMSWEHAKACRPLGAMYIDVGLILAYNVFADFQGAPVDGRRQRWIIDALAQLNSAGGESQQMGEVEWTGGRIELLGAWFTAGSVGRSAVGDGRLSGRDGETGSYLVVPPNGLRIAWPSTRLGQ